jgi:hypothetical protein
VVKVDGVVSDGQADTGTSAGAVLFGGDPKERFKQIFQGIGGNTRSPVGNHDQRHGLLERSPQMMNKLYIASTNVNLEIIAKLLNSVAEKYGCYVRFEKRENSLKFIGDESYWGHIIEELMEFFFPQMEMTAAAIKVASPQ